MQNQCSYSSCGELNHTTDTCFHVADKLSCMFYLILLAPEPDPFLWSDNNKAFSVGDIWRNVPVAFIFVLCVLVLVDTLGSVSCQVAAEGCQMPLQ